MSHVSAVNYLLTFCCEVGWSEWHALPNPERKTNAYPPKNLILISQDTILLPHNCNADLIIFGTYKSNLILLSHLQNCVTELVTFLRPFEHLHTKF